MLQITRSISFERDRALDSLPLLRFPNNFPAYHVLIYLALCSTQRMGM